jgi:hypothetical protein
MNVSPGHFEVISSLDLDKVKLKLMHVESGEGWGHERAEAAEAGYRRFLYLTRKYPGEPIAPSVDVDTFWHYHILDTVKYANDCDAVFGHFLHHDPYVGIGEDASPGDQVRAGERMRELHEAEFGTGAKLDPAQQSTAWCTVTASTTAAAWCTVTAPKNGAAWCTVTAPKAKSAWCTVTDPQARAAWCTVTATQGTTAWCTVTAPTGKTAWCTVTAAGSKAAWCTVTSPETGTAWCTVTQGDRKNAQATPVSSSAWYTVTSAASADKRALAASTA